MNDSDVIPGEIMAIRKAMMNSLENSYKSSSS